jgi:membrane protein implicated in regulation of membrane protease activity
MDDWVFWLIAAVILGVGETATMGFFLAPFAVGALAAAVLSLAGAGLAPCLIVAIAVSILMLFGLRPLARSHRRLPPKLRTGTARLVGCEAVVLEPTDQDHGSIKLEGEHWSARAFEADRVYEPGERVQVIEIRGATALVTE